MSQNIPKLKHTLYRVKLDVDHPERTYIEDRFLEKEWTRITDPDQFLEIWGSNMMPVAQKLYKYAAFVHETDPYFTKNIKFMEMKQNIVKSYGEKFELYMHRNGILEQDVLDTYTIYKLADLVFEAFGHVLTFDLKAATFTKSDKVIQTPDVYNNYSHKQLKAECEYFKLASKSGSKAEIMERLEKERLKNK